MANTRYTRLIACAGAITLGACGTRTTVQPTPANRSFDPVCVDGVAVFDDFSRVPYDYYEVAFISSQGNSVYNGKGDALLAMRKRGGEQGGNAIVVNSLRVKAGTIKVIGAALGADDAERTGRSVAIYMPADSLRVKNACGHA
ncbi:MAG: hypothetical protein ACR2GG_03315 [Gemmatimonadaceae bacterium]